MIATSRCVHYLLLALTLACVAGPNLGSMSLWDMDEGVNAECGREMLEIGTWIVPTFNYDLRTAKPVMLYWLQRISYANFGVNEFAARLPSVLMSLGTLLLVYELGRRMFDAGTGLLAGIALASCIEFVKLTRAATPDATFIFFSTLTLASFWFLHGSRAWFIPTALAAGLAMLTKGPAGVALPGLVIALYLAWNRELGTLWNRRLITAGMAFLLVAAPWYILVTTETRGAYIKAFFGHENVNRFLAPMENHRGPMVYYVLAIIIFFAPWSSVIGATLWTAVRTARQSLDTSEARPFRFLLLWFAAYLVFFSFAATKLPNYIAPLYPALALLTATFLRRWAQGTLPVARWVMPVAVAGIIGTGVVITVGLLMVSNTINLNLKGLRILPEIAPWAALGLIPILAGVAILQLIRREQRQAVPVILGVASVSLIALLVSFPAMIVDAAKAPKALVEMSGTKQPERDIRLASLEYTQESVTFYAERRVERMYSPQMAVDFLSLPRPGYLFVPVRTWEEKVAPQAGPHRVVARRYDFYRNTEILVVTNEGAER